MTHECVIPLLFGSVDTIKTRLACAVAARKATAEASVVFILNEEQSYDTQLLELAAS